MRQSILRATMAVLFGALVPAAGRAQQQQPAPADFAISDTVSTYWTNFAKRGDSNGPGVPIWPQFIDDERQLMHFKNEAFPGPAPSAEAPEVLDAYFAWRRTTEGAAWAK